VVLEQKVRADARATMEYFAEQDVSVKVISGDNAVSVDAVVGKLGLHGETMDARQLPTDQAGLAGALETHTTFGRVPAALGAIPLSRQTAVGGNSAEWFAARQDLAMAYPPSIRLSTNDIHVGSGSTATIAHDGDGFGPHSGGVAVPSIGDDDVGDDVRQRVLRTDRQRPVTDGVDPDQDAITGIADVIHDVAGEQLVQTVEPTLVEQVSMQGERFADRPLVFSRQHDLPLSGEFPYYLPR
jgi:hypothetical protein